MSETKMTTNLEASIDLSYLDSSTKFYTCVALIDRQAACCAMSRIASSRRCTQSMLLYLSIDKYNPFYSQNPGKDDEDDGDEHCE